MESSTDALANDDDANGVPCITVATIHVVTYSSLVALYYRRKLYRAIFHALDGKNMAADIEPHNIDITKPFNRKEKRGDDKDKLVFIVTVTTRRRDPVDAAGAELHARNMQDIVNAVPGKHISRRDVSSTGSAFTRSQLESADLAVVTA